MIKMKQEEVNLPEVRQLVKSQTCVSLFFLIKDFIYVFLERGEEGEKVRERNINAWLPLAFLLLGTWPATQAYALTGN